MRFASKFALWERTDSNVLLGDIVPQLLMRMCSQLVCCCARLRLSAPQEQVDAHAHFLKINSRGFHITTE